MLQPRIHLMPPLLANQIAAGEVVERPASVVKELLENSLDAGATQIHIDLERCGIERIRIRDDGHGIVKEDLALAVSRHATSKVLKPEDLQAIASLGFRGEALASIAAVAKIALTSKAQTEEHAWCFQSDPAVIDSYQLEPAAHPQGTTIDVNHLFFNMPARRKFLRSDRTELNHLETIVKQIALSRHDVQIILKHQQSILISARKADTPIQIKQRIASICGQSFIDDAIEIDVSDDSLHLYGWLGRLDSARTQTDTQYFYVNGRIVRDKTLNHAVRMAYQDLIPEGRYPCYVLYLELPPATVDVNVHPTKHEVRFYQSRHIHDFVAFHLDRALHGSSLSQSDITSSATQDEMQYLATTNISKLAIQEPLATYYAPLIQSPMINSFDENKIESPVSTLNEFNNNSSLISNEIENNRVTPAKQSSYQLIGLIKNSHLLVEHAVGLVIFNIE
ncbi:MAG: DNA mismatch repair endonuclease MutL, partial [Gammaproteobacteria bacterium]